MKVASWAYLTRVQTMPERIPAECSFPLSLPFVRTLDLAFTKPVTFFVGENGTGKSTLLEAIAVLCRLPVSGGGRSELADRHGPERGSELSQALRPTFHRHPLDGYFLRAEFHAHFATLLDEREADPDFIEDPFMRYGGRSLHTRSHGESFLNCPSEPGSRRSLSAGRARIGVVATAAVGAAESDGRTGSRRQDPACDRDPLADSTDVPGRTDRLF